MDGTTCQSIKTRSKILAPTAAAPTLSEKLTHFLGVSASLIAMLFLIRLVVDTGTRLVYPFLPQLASGIGVGVTGFSWLLFLRSWIGLAGPLFGVWADRYGRRKIMVIGLLALAVGMLGVALLPGWWTVLPILCWGVGMTAFVPAQQAYISDIAVATRRGRALAAVDSAFAMSGVMALPLVGWLIAQVGWRAPLVFLSLLCAGATLAIRRRLPHQEHRAVEAESLAGMGRAVRSPRVLATVLVGFLLFVAYGAFMTIWSIWLSAEFQLDVLAISVIATLMGLAELVGVITTGLFIDRMGKRRGSFGGILLLAVSFALLPLTQGNLLWAKSLLIGMGALWEYTIVAHFPLFAEQLPEARATLFALVSLGISIGLAVASPLAVGLWNASGLGAVALVSTLALVLALLVGWRWLHE